MPTDGHETRIRGVGLVLSGGGTVGHAFHSGVLAAIAEATGWDARTADLAVGTSAGSLVAAMLRAGFPAPDLAARVLGRPLSAEGGRVAELLGALKDLPAWAAARPRPRVAP